MNEKDKIFLKYIHKDFRIVEVFTLAGGISSNAPNSSKVILLYSLLADNKLCSITALSKIVEPITKKEE